MALPGDARKVITTTGGKDYIIDSSLGFIDDDIQQNSFIIEYGDRRVSIEEMIDTIDDLQDRLSEAETIIDEMKEGKT